MTNWFDGMGEVISAIFSFDSFTMTSAFNLPASWPVGLIVLLILAYIVLFIYRLSPFVERYLEPTVMVTSYLAIAGIIFVEVIRRFVFQLQAPWSTTIPPFLFLIMTWFGCSYNVKLRTHLSFAEFRTAMPRAGQFACLMLDAVLWISFSWVVFVTSIRTTVNKAANFQIMLGTDNIMQWWFLISLPIAFVLLTARVLENVHEDVSNYKSGDVLIKQAVIGGE